MNAIPAQNTCYDKVLAKMIHGNNLKIVLIGCALIISTLEPSLASRFLPDQLRCESDIYYQNTNVDKTVSQYLVQEYVDFIDGRSSLEVQDGQTGEMSIYYNELGPASLPRRKFLVYDFASNTCRKTGIQNWPLGRIRKIILYMLPMDKMGRETCDIALGPSALLVAIEQCQDDFMFVQQKFSESYLTKVDIYERPIQEADFIAIVTLRVVSQNRAQSKMQQSSLTNATTYGQLDFLSATVCEVSHDKMKNRRVGVEYECEESEVIFDADYHLVAQRVSGSLVGRALEESSNFDFRRDPFMRPLGIGCWRDYDLSGRKKFIIPTLQFSAEYITSNGSAGSTYVAYDGYRRLLRLDREERKSIYDLDRAVSYHARSSSPVREVSDWSTPTSESCVVLDITDKGLLGTETLERLMGLGTARLTHYMGSKMVDHVAYDVFELELTYDDMGSFELPIFMEPTGYVAQRTSGAGGPTASGRLTRYYLDFYLHDDEGTADKMGTYRDEDSRSTLTSSMVPKFIELWEVNGLGEKSLVNRLEFIEFMWSLEVQPEGDPDTQDMSHIFYAKSCTQSRSTNWQVRFQVSQDTDRQLSPIESAAFRANKQLIREVLQNEIANSLDISRLRIAQLDVTFLPRSLSANLLVEARVVRLQTSTFHERTRGYVSFVETMNTLKDHVKAFKYNRHSMESCKLDSLTGQVSGKTSLMFCRGLTICVIFERDTLNARLDSHDIELVSEEPIEAVRSSNPLVAKCEIRESDWFANMEPDPQALDVRMLNNNPVEVRFRYIEPNQQTKFAVYRGHTHDTQKKRLDSVGLTTIARQAPLVGLRYTTVQEDPRARNMNIPIKLEGSQSPDEKFGYCQLSCQFDEYCESFSICKGKKQSASDCILSTLRLTGPRVETLAEKLRSNASEQDLEIRFAAVNGESEEVAKVFGFRKETECNIHPRDIISSYLVFSSFNLTKPNGSSGEKPVDQENVKSLEDCAAQSFDEKVNMNLITSNFTYCPLSSTCRTNKPMEGTSTSVTRGQLCTLYTRQHTQYYKYYSSTHMAVIVDNGTTSTTSTSTPSPTNKHADSMASHPIIQSDIGRTIEGLSVEECARDCSLFHSNCLAFDSCHPKGLATSLCIMYPIKSPASSDNYRKNQETKVEPSDKQGANSITAKLVTNFACNHFALKGSYLDIKLRQMTDGKINDLPQRSDINKFEDSIIDNDQRRGDETMRQAIERAAASSGSSGDGASTASNFHFILFLLGTVVACAGFISAGGAPVWVMDHWERLRVRLSPRYRGHRISQLALASDEP